MPRELLKDRVKSRITSVTKTAETLNNTYNMDASEPAEDKIDDVEYLEAYTVHTREDRRQHSSAQAC